MIGIDTNVLLRYLIEDDRPQAKISKRLLDDLLTADAPGYVSSVVLVELVWVLRATYRVEHEGIAEIVKRLLGESSLVLEHQDEVYFALAEYRQGTHDFSDALIAAVCASAGCSTTFTFDKRAARHAGLTLLA